VHVGSGRAPEGEMEPECGQLEEGSGVRVDEGLRESSLKDNRHKETSQETVRVILGFCKSDSCHLLN